MTSPWFSRPIQVFSVQLLVIIVFLTHQKLVFILKVPCSHWLVAGWASCFLEQLLFPNKLHMIVRRSLKASPRFIPLHSRRVNRLITLHIHTYVICNLCPSPCNPREEFFVVTKELLLFDIFSKFWLRLLDIYIFVGAASWVWRKGAYATARFIA